MKIAQIDPSLFTWPYDSELVSALRAEGHEAILFGRALAPGDSRAQSAFFSGVFYPSLARASTQKASRPMVLALKGLSHIGSMRRLVRELERWRPAVIHFQWLPLPVVDRHFLARFRRIAPVVLTVHDTKPFNDNPRSRLQRLGAVAIMSQVDRLIVHTKAGVDRLISYGIPAGRISRIPHGLLHNGTPGGSPVVPAAPAAATPDGTLTLLQFGLVKPYKGIDILIQALARMQPASRAKCRVRIVGRPHMDTEPLVTLARDLGVADRIAFDFRFVPEAEMHAMFEEASVLLFPYREIDASGVLMTALALGKPIVASRLGIFAEMIEDQRHGLLVPPGDADALARALDLLAESPALQEQLQRGIEDLRAAIPDWHTIARSTADTYAAAIAGWRKGH